MMAHAQPPTDPFGDTPGIDPASLRPGVDKLEVCRYGGRRPFGAKGIYLGHREGVAVVDFGEGPESMEPAQLTEAERINSSIDFLDFDCGYADGAEAFWDRKVTGGKSFRNKPTPYSRGFLKGFNDAKANRFRTFSVAPFNEVVRELGSLYPDEYPEGKR